MRYQRGKHLQLLGDKELLNRAASKGQIGSCIEKYKGYCEPFLQPYGFCLQARRRGVSLLILTKLRSIYVLMMVVKAEYHDPGFSK